MATATYNGEVPTPTFVKTEKAEDRIPLKLAVIPHAMPLQNKAEEECRWGQHCPICPKSNPNPKVGSSENWNNKRQNQFQRNYYPQSPQYSPSYDIPDRFFQQYKLEKEWNERMEHLNDKYNLDYYSSSESKSEFEPEHKYETLI